MPNQRARFVVRPIPAEEMQSVGDVIVHMNQNRLSRGMDVTGKPARPLSSVYRRNKVRRGDAPARDWYFTGLTRQSMAVIRSSPNEVVVGFNNPTAARRAAIRNADEKQFGIAEAERADLKEEISKARPIEVAVTRG